MSNLAKKILHAIWNLVKGIVIFIVAIFSLLYVMDLSEPGTSALITKDTNVYSDPAAEIKTDTKLSSCYVVEKIGDPNSFGYTKIRFDTSEIGYVPSSYLLDTSVLIQSDNVDATHVAKVELDNISFKDSSEDNITCRVLKDLTHYQEDQKTFGVYIVVGKANNFSLLVSTLEELHIPYGFFVKCDDFSTTMELTSFVSEELVDIENQYNILPMTLDLTGSKFSEYELQNKFSDEIAFSGVRSGDNYWTIVLHEEIATNEFNSSSNFAIEYEKEGPNEYISLIRLNNESLLFSSFLEKYKTLTE